MKFALRMFFSLSSNSKFNLIGCIFIISYSYHKSLTNYHIILYQVHLAWAGLELTTLVVIGTDCIGSFRSNYNTFTTPRLPLKNWMNEQIYFTLPISTITITSLRSPATLSCKEKGYLIWNVHCYNRFDVINV